MSDPTTALALRTAAQAGFRPSAYSGLDVRVPFWDGREPGEVHAELLCVCQQPLGEFGSHSGVLSRGSSSP